MKNIHLLITLVSISIFSLACQPPEPFVEYIAKIDSEAVGPYLTNDHHGNPVLCWTELDMQDSLYRLKYAIYDTQSATFSNPITVAGSEGSSTAAESMSKVAFKSDGTVIALFNKRFENSKSRFASAIYYTLSQDGGENWAEPQFIHSETSQDYGRSFFNITTLEDGEVAAIWLDGRFGDAEKGSALFFARTEAGQGFGEEVCLDKNTCECCRTEIFKDHLGGIHIAYRGIQQPLEHLGKQVRDMVYTFSSDNGKTFIPSLAISKDNWEIEGCPHTGPSLAYNEDGINALWFTGGGIPGLYLSSLKNNNEAFTAKIEMSTAGRHPQMISLNENVLAMVWDEVFDEKQQAVDATMEEHGMTMVHNSSSKESRIVLTLFNQGEIKQYPISSELHTAHHPVIISSGDGALVAWINEAGGKPSITYSFIKID